MNADLSKLPPGASVRTFLAIDLPAEVKSAIGQVESAFESESRLLKWVAPDLLHITVRFLGGLPLQQVEDVKEAARSAASAVPAFTLSYAGLGAFPNERSPRVLWVGLTESPGLAHLRRLSTEVETQLSRRGFAADKTRFSPHITIGRVRDSVSSADRRLVGTGLQRARTTSRVEGRFPVNELVVVRSRLGPSGPHYSPLAEFPLGAEERRQ